MTNDGSEKVTWKANWNPVTNTTTITDNSGTRVVDGNQTSPTFNEGSSRAGGISPTGIISGQSRLGESGISPTGIISGQSNLLGGGYSATGITANNSNSPTGNDKKKKNVSGTLEHSS